VKVLRFNEAKAVPVLTPGRAPMPSPDQYELLIRVCAAGIIPAEVEWYPTSHTKSGGPRSGAIPSHEFSGVVAGLGDGVGSLELGRAVFGMNDWFADGAIAEYCIAPFHAVAPKPSRLTHTEAASVPISALTAWQGLLDRAHLEPGERVLVHGAAGAVGTFAVQLARRNGAHVIATASEANAEFVKELGAEQVIDYRTTRFEDIAAGVDVVFDTVGGEVLQRSWSVLRPGGRLVTIASGEENQTDARTKAAFFIVEPDQRQLSIVAVMLDSGQLRTVVDTAVPLERARDAFADKKPGIHRGKVVVTIAEANSSGGENYDSNCG
jgi:NADPH:quinone reductase-like Zn-dependent oxidoreductase